jgi:lysophospholipase L1-like esterase
LVITNYNSSIFIWWINNINSGFCCSSIYLYTFLNLKVSLKIFFISVILFLISDYLLGKSLLNILNKKNIFITFDSQMNRNIKNEKNFRVKNIYFSHTLENNYTGISYFGNKVNKICTNQYGFKSNCKNIQSDNNFDYWFIGDSFTEGVGLSYNNTFVGIFDLINVELNVANLGVSSYSPIIYFHKLKFFLDKGLKTKNVIIFLDISDFTDEKFRKECDKKVCIKDLSKKIDFRNTQSSYKLKKLIKERFIFTLSFLQYGKKLFCENFLISHCSYVYNKNFVKSNWINDFDLKIKTDKELNESFHQSIYYLNKIEKLLNKNNISFSLAIYPWPGNILYGKKNIEYREYFKQYCKSKCKFFIDYFNEFQKKIDQSDKNFVIKQFYFYGDMHFNKKGNELIAKKLIEILD